MHRVASAQHRHSPHRTTIDMQATRAFTQLQPGAAAVDSELDAGLVRTIHQTGLAVGIVADRVHAPAQDQVGTFTVGKSQSEVIHAGKI
jgi:hypothetical protein